MTSVHKEWSTPVAAGVALVVGAVALAAAAIASYADPPALMFIGVAAVLLAVVGTVTLIRRPRLALDGSTLTVRTLTGRIELTPVDVEQASMLKTRRLMARGQQLLLDLSDDKLLIFGRWDLGADPREVLDALRDAGFRVDHPAG